jgi:hypothetical protein
VFLPLRCAFPRLCFSFRRLLRPLELDVLFNELNEESEPSMSNDREGVVSRCTGGNSSSLCDIPALFFGPPIVGNLSITPV